MSTEENTTTSDNIRERKNKPGTKRDDLCNWEPYKSLDEIDSIFATQEFIQQEIHNNPGNIDKVVVLEKDLEEREKEGWILEHFRQFLIEISNFIVFHNDVCTQETNPEMKIKNPTGGLNSFQNFSIFCAFSENFQLFQKKSQRTIWFSCQQSLIRHNQFVPLITWCKHFLMLKKP